MTAPTTTDNGQATAAVPFEPPATAAAPVQHASGQPADRPRRAHSAPTREQLKARWKATPKWFRWPAVAIVSGGLSYFAWSFVIAPTVAGFAQTEARKEVATVYSPDNRQLAEALVNNDEFIAAFAGFIDERAAAAVAAGRPSPVVVVDAPLAWLPCPLNIEAEGFIGANTSPDAQSKLNPDRAEAVQSGIQAAQAQGAALTALRVTLNRTTGLPEVTTNAALGVPLLDCTARASAPTATPAASSTPVTPPPNAG